MKNSDEPTSFQKAFLLAERESRLLQLQKLKGVPTDILESATKLASISQSIVADDDQAIRLLPAAREHFKIIQKREEFLEEKSDLYALQVGLNEIALSYEEKTHIDQTMKDPQNQENWKVIQEALKDKKNERLTEALIALISHIYIDLIHSIDLPALNLEIDE